ncbi:phage portal protein [Candidatus Palauibacter sp.]|uniref:phage portal protein n=1 Tax=Candidatus Palauibacter sp. TaxID=3101350 RepID=UPI003CC5C2BA
MSERRVGLFRRWAAGFGGARVESSADERLPVASGGHLVPANTTWSQILDYVSGSGEWWPLEFFQVGLPLTRNVAISYATLNRCVTLVAGSVAQLVTGGGLRVVDLDGRTRTTRRARQIVEVLSTSPDGGVTPSHSFIEDAAADYCLDGNALLVPSITMDGMLTGLRRMSAWDADVMHSAAGDAIYRLAPADGPVGAREYAAARDVVHVRWPRLSRYGGTRTGRDGFALAPVVALRPALEIGIQGDRYIRDWFVSGAKSKLHVNFETGERELAPEQRKQLVDWVDRYSQSRQPLVTFDGSSTKIDDTPQDEEALGLREFQVQEVAKVYGVPSPLLGVDITQWGSGIEQLAKLFWRFGLRQHVDRFLASLGTRLLRRGDRFAIDTTDLLRGDAEAIEKMINAVRGDAQRPAVATREEMRHIAGLPVDPVGEFVEPAPAGSPSPPRRGSRPPAS